MKRPHLSLSVLALASGLALPPAASATAAQAMPPSSSISAARAPEQAEVTVIQGSGASLVLRTIPTATVAEARERAAALDALPGVQAEVTRELALQADPYASQQWQLSASKVPSDARATGVTVAVVDTGVDATHPDLKNVVLPGYDAINSAAMPVSSDNGYHGTFVAGIIGAEADNNLYGRGAAPGARILPVKVCTSSCPTDAVARGIIWAYQNGAKVINLSLGGAYPSVAMEQAVLAAESAGVVVVAAAGNDGTSNPSYPGSYPTVMNTGAVDQQNLRASFSQWGSTVDIGAPGVQLVSTAPVSQFASGLAVASGTSFASPMVAAAAALALAKYPTLTPAQVRQHLLTTGATGPADLGGKSLDVTSLLATTPSTGSTTTAPSTTTTTTAPSTTTSPTTTTPKSKIATPAFVTLRGTDSTLSMSYTPVSNATAYRIALSNGFVATTTGTQVSWRGLPYSTPITVTVQALTTRTGYENSAVSAPSDPVTLLRTPAAPVLTPSDRSLSVAFNTIMGATSYRVDLSDGSSKTVSSSPAVFSNLTNGRSYSARVTALTANSASNRSAASAYVKPYGAPLMSLSTPTAVSTSAGRLSIRWTAPQVNGAPLTRLELIDNNGGVITLSPSARTFTVQALAPGTTRSYTLRATNAGGSSLSSESAAAVVIGPPSLTTAVKAADSRTFSLTGQVYNSTTLVSVRLERYNGSSWSFVADVPVTERSFSYDVTAPGRTTYRVRAGSFISANVTVG